MVPTLSITAVVENTAGKFNFLGEWGLALWIEAGPHRILYDTGQGRTLIDNARLLGIDLRDAQALVISHGHSDHSGGIAALMAHGFHGKVYIHPKALEKKYQLEGDPPPRLKGIPPACEAALRDHGADVIHSAVPTEIAPGLIVTGTIPRRNDFEAKPGPYFLDEAGATKDPLIDDQALMIETPKGWVVITGCGHAGVVNTVRYAAELAGSGNIYAVAGGMHLFAASPQQVRTTAEQLRELRVPFLAPCHCTGIQTVGVLQAEFGTGVKPLSAGIRQEF